MTDPERLLDCDGAGLSAALLRAGREEGPSEKLLSDTLLAVGVGAAVAGAGAAASALAAGSSGAMLKAGGTTSLTTLAIKWLGIGAVGGVVTVGAAVGVEDRMHAAPAPQLAVVAPPASVEPRAAAPKPSPGPALAEPEPQVAAPTTPPPSAPSIKPAVPSIAEETRAIDQARRELSAGNASGALGTLDAYDRLPGPRRLQQEALLLRMDALVKAGNAGAARVVAKSLLDQSPSGPHAARARQVLGSVAQKE